MNEHQTALSSNQPTGPICDDGKQAGVPGRDTSRQQGEILTAVLGDPDAEVSLTSLAERLRLPYPSVHREIERAEQAGLVVSRRIGNPRLVRANPDSPYYSGLTDVLLKAFGPPAIIGVGRVCLRAEPTTSRPMCPA